jgi:hypothetical protein
LLIVVVGQSELRRERSARKNGGQAGRSDRAPQIE